MFFEPTVFDNVDNASEIAQNEVFGPVLCIIPFGTEDEAVELANATPCGGYKMSGHGREMGFAVMEALTQEKSVWISLR